MASMWNAWLSSAVAVQVEAAAVVRPHETEIGGHPDMRASCASLMDQSIPAISPINFAESSTPDPLGQ